MILDRTSCAGSRVPVALLGKVYCNADADDHPIEVGDLLTTSSRPGHSMKAGEPAKAFGAVLGKALRTLSAGPRRDSRACRIAIAHGQPLRGAPSGIRSGQTALAPELGAGSVARGMPAPPETWVAGLGASRPPTATGGPRRGIRGRVSKSAAGANTGLQPRERTEVPKAPVRHATGAARRIPLAPLL
jgi:hypothetical protein